MDNQEAIRHLNFEIALLYASYINKLKPSDICRAFITEATILALAYDQNELEGLRTVLKGLENGVSTYETTYS